MIVTDTTPPTDTFQDVPPGTAFQVKADGKNCIRHNTGTGSTNLDTGAVESFANGTPVTIAPSATVAMFPSA